MKKRLRFIGVLSLALSFSAQAGSPAPGATWKDKCPDFKTCVDAVSALTGEEYLYNAHDIGAASISITATLPFIKDDADLIFTNILNDNALARVMVRPNLYNILRTSDAKGKDLPVFKCDLHQPPKLPNLKTSRPTRDEVQSE